MKDGIRHNRPLRHKAMGTRGSFFSDQDILIDPLLTELQFAAGSRDDPAPIVFGNGEPVVVAQAGSGHAKHLSDMCLVK